VRVLALLLLGVMVGVFTAILQAQRIQVGQVWVPTGVVLALAVLVPIARAAAWWLRSRWGAACLGLGWLVATLTLGTSASRGDLILDSGPRQISYLVIGSVLLAACATFPLLEPTAGGVGGREGAADRSPPALACEPALEPSSDRKDS
jgi:hypothetical protein